MIPGYFVIFFGAILYSLSSLTYALYLSPRAYWIAVAGWILSSSALTLISLNAHWAYEGNLTRWQARPLKNYNAGSKWWCAAKHGVVFFLCMVPLITHFTQVLPHWLLRYSGAPEVSELLVESKGRVSSRYKRGCENLVEVSSAKYRSDNLCLESDLLYAELKVGDTLIVEGKANWIGLLVDRPIAVRDADSGLERLVHVVPRRSWFSSILGIEHFYSRIHAVAGGI